MTSKKPDIESRDDIIVFVDAFYEQIRSDSLLAPVFNMKIPSDQWQQHQNRMYDFWYAMIFYGDRYEGNPLAKHIRLPISQKHFERWLELFHQTIDTYFEGLVAEEVKLRSNRIASVFVDKIEQFNDWQSSKSENE